MIGAALDRVFRTASARIIGAIAVRFRDLDLAEDAFADACTRALAAWPNKGVPSDPSAWLYRVAERAALDMLRRRGVRERAPVNAHHAHAYEEGVDFGEECLIPDERLRLIFICCHPAVAPNFRAALTLRVVCGIPTAALARAFLVPEPTMAQRLVRTKHKIAAAGVPFATPGPRQWSERMEAVLSTLEVAYARSHEDALAQGSRADLAIETLHLSRVLTELVPEDGAAQALAALLHYAESRRPARVDGNGMMIRLSDQDPTLWNRDLIATADRHFQRALQLAANEPRTIQAALQNAWCSRSSLQDPPPWMRVLELYDRLLDVRDDPVVRINRAVAFAYIASPALALEEVEQLDHTALSDFAPFHALRADLLARVGRRSEAARTYRKLQALAPGAAERLWIEQQLAGLEDLGAPGASA